MYLGILILSFMHLFIQQEYIHFVRVTHSAAVEVPLKGAHDGFSREREKERERKEGKRVGREKEMMKGCQSV